jgi:hypothetical protein
MEFVIFLVFAVGGYLFLIGLCEMLYERYVRDDANKNKHNARNSGLNFVCFLSPCIGFCFVVAQYGTDDPFPIYFIYAWCIGVICSVLALICVRSHTIKLAAKATLYGCLTLLIFIILIIIGGAYAMSGWGDEPLGI